MDKTKLNLERLRAYDAEWEENKHPRADNGQFTSGSGSAGGGANSGSSAYSNASKNVEKNVQRLASMKNNMAAFEAVAAWQDASETMKEPLYKVDAMRQHLLENQDELREYGDDKFDAVMKELDKMYDDLSNGARSDFDGAGEQKSSLRKAAEAIKGGSGKSEGFNYSPEKKKNVLEILQRDINSFGPQSPVGEINSSLMNDLQKGKSFTVAVNNAKEKFKGKSDEHDAQLYNFYVMSKGPQGNENFSKEYKGNDFRSRKKVLEAEADSWLES